MSGLLAALALCLTAGVTAGGGPRQTTIDQAIVQEPDAGRAPQITTAQLREMLAKGDAVLLDARPAEEFAISHIPGALNVSQKAGTPMSLYISDVAEAKRLVPHLDRPLIVYCNGPFCGKSRRFADDLMSAGYRNVRRYQLGMPGWRTAGGVTVIEASAVRRVAELDRTAVFIDGGLGNLAPVPRIVKVRSDEITRAKDDGRLPMHDHNTRIIVLASTAAQARAVAEALAANAFHNVAYYDGDGSVLDQPTR
jgi:rhodanese-related sulfurtransferase